MHWTARQTKIPAHSVGITIALHNATPLIRIHSTVQIALVIWGRDTAADRNCPKFVIEKHKIMEWVPENKFKFFPTDDPATWRLLNNPGIWEEQKKQNPHPCAAIHEPSNTDTRHQQRFMEDWQTIQCQRGRPHAPQGQQQGVSSNTGTGANTGAVDSGWPVRPTQTTLENYFQNPMQTQAQMRWGDQEEELRMELCQKENREHTPLKYVDAWKPTKQHRPKTHTDPITKCEQVTDKPARPTSKSKMQHLWYNCYTGAIYRLQQ